MAFDPAALHELSSKHRSTLEAVGVGCCFYCGLDFMVEEIKEWIDGAQTALCPHCGVDAVLPGSQPEDWLRDMGQRYFGPELP